MAKPPSKPVLSPDIAGDVGMDPLGDERHGLYSPASLERENRRISAAHKLPAPPDDLAVPAENLQPGQSGEAVGKLQRCLVAAGLVSEPDLALEVNRYGLHTQRAVRALQESSGISATGEYGGRTRAALGAALAARK